MAVVMRSLAVDQSDTVLPEHDHIQRWQLAKTVAVDAAVRVKLGERIVLDGKIVTGRTTVDQALISGEHLPVDKTEGDPVFTGTIDGAGSFDYRVSAATFAFLYGTAPS